jgi:CBS domain-containing protein
MQIKDVLLNKTRALHTIRPDHRVADAIERLSQHNIGSLPVLERNGELVGIFSERDVLIGVHDHGVAFRDMKVGDVMTPDPVTCDVYDDVHRAMGKMTEHRIGQLPVLDEDRRVVGVVSVGDLIKLLYERVEAENKHLLNYLYGPG